MSTSVCAKTPPKASYGFNEDDRTPSAAEREEEGECERTSLVALSEASASLSSSETSPSFLAVMKSTLRSLWHFYKRNADDYKKRSVVFVPLITIALFAVFLSLWVKYEGCPTYVRTPSLPYISCSAEHPCVALYNTPSGPESVSPALPADRFYCGDGFCQYSDYHMVCWDVFNMVWGGLVQNRVFQQREWWRLITISLHHSSWWHLLSNLASLLFIGLPLEQRHGFLVALAYAIGVWGSSVFIMTPGLGVQPDTIVVGASGAIMAIYGFFLMEQFLFPLELLGRVFAGSFAVSQTVFLALEPIFFPGNCTAGHAGGLVTGLFTGLFLLPFMTHAKAHPVAFVSPTQKKIEVAVGAAGLLGLLVIWISASPRGFT